MAGPRHDAAPADRAWQWIIGFGVLLALVSILPFLQPIPVGLAVAQVAGITLGLVGILTLWAGSSHWRWRHQWLDLGLGALSLLLGLSLFVFPAAGAQLLAWIIGIWLLVCGVSELVTIATVRLNRGWLIILAVIDIVLGLFLLAADAVTALTFVAFTIGLSLALRGISLVVLGFLVRQLSRSRALHA